MGYILFLLQWRAYCTCQIDRYTTVRWSWTVHKHSWIVHECSWTKNYERSSTCSWTVHEYSWTTNETFIKVHEFMNLFCSWTLTLFMTMGCSRTVMNSDNSWTLSYFMNNHDLKKFMNQIVNEHSWTFLKCVHKLFMNVPEQQMRHSWMHELST